MPQTLQAKVYVWIYPAKNFGSLPYEILVGKNTLEVLGTSIFYRVYHDPGVSTIFYMVVDFQGIGIPMSRTFLIHNPQAE